MEQAKFIQDRRGVAEYKNYAAIVAMVGLLYSALFPGVSSWTVTFAIVLFGAVAWYLLEKVSRPPKNNPAAFLRFIQQQKKQQKDAKVPVLVCLGDSITHGNASANYTTMLVPKLRCQKVFESFSCQDDKAKRQKQKQTTRAVFEYPLHVVNAGQNGICSYTIFRERVSHALVCQPDFVCLLIGTNDVSTMVRGGPKRQYQKMKTWNLPEPPSIDNYRTNVTGIIDSIQQSSPATHIGICTIPPQTEDLNLRVNQMFITKANQVLHDIVKEKNPSSSGGTVSIIPLHETLEEKLKDKPRQWNNLPYGYQKITKCFVVPLRHLLGISYNVLSKPFSAWYLYDNIHFNENGANLLADLIVEWLVVHPNMEVKQLKTE